ncbi:neuraminidase-like domain-containing protein [Streptomyces antibioticus]|uniref:Tc toxin subunit A-related protein n=1 Tax=Streptomyces antibioticus TaxID=1890 RepID=UPI0037230AC0
MAVLHAGLLGQGLEVPHDELVESMFAAGTRRALLDFQHAHDLPTTGVADERAQDMLARESGDARYVVGWVLGPDGRPAPGLTMRAFDRNLRGERVLGEGASEDDGFYRIDYSSRRAVDAVGTPDVFVRAYSDERPLTDPSLDDVVFNSAELVSITVFLRTRTPPRETDYERVRRVTAPALSDIPWHELREDDVHADVTFLTRETELPRHEIEHMSAAERMSAHHGGAPECWYAVLATDLLLTARHWTTATPLFHIGVHTPGPDLLYATALVRPDLRREAVRRAVDEFIVPRTALDLLDAYEAFLDEHREAAREYQRRARIEIVFRQVQNFVTSDARDHVLRVLQEDPLGDLGGLLSRLRDAGWIAAEHARQVETGLTLSDLIGDESVQSRLERRHGIKKPGDIRRLAALGEDDWAWAIRAGAKTPNDAATADRVAGQARALTRRMEERFPTTAFAARLGRDGDTVLARAGEVAEVLAAEPEFDLADGNVTLLLRHRAEARRAMRRRTSQPSPEEVAAESELRGALLTAQRVFKLTPRYEQSKVLLANAVTSASDIQAMGRTRFVSLALESGEFTAPEASRAYARAAAQHAAALMLAGQLRAASDATRIAALGSTSTARQAAAESFPNMRTLFGAGDMCACEECRSVHGAAAYLVDVLQFLKHRLVVDTTTTPAVTLKQAKDVLFARRPDLGDTDLSCPNTNTPMPYLDLVCELLEEAVAPDPGFGYAGAVSEGVADTALLSALRGRGWAFGDGSVVSGPDLAGGYVVRDTAAVARLTPSGGRWTVRRLRQTYGSAAEVAAAPEYVNADAYVTLAGTKSAFGLPFDLAHEETAGYFALLGAHRSDLMGLLATGAVPTAAETAADRLGMSHAEHMLVVTAAPAAQDSIWNTPGAAAALANVDAFVKRSGIDYTELLALVDLAWVDGGQDLFVRHLDPSCDLAAKEIAHLDDAALDRIHRFERLRRASGLPAATLDRMIRHEAAGAGKLDDTLIERLVLLRTLADRLRLPVDSLLDLLGPLDPAGSTYHRVFLAGTTVGEVDPDFRPEAVAASEAAEAATPGTGVRLADHAGYLAVALGATSDDVAVLLEERGGDPALTSVELGLIHGLWRLSRQLRLRVADLVELIALTGVDPLASAADLDSWSTAATTVRLSGTDVPRLVHLLRHEAGAPSAVEPSTQAVTAFVEALDTALQDAADATASPYDTRATSLENAAAVRAHAGLLPSLSADDRARLVTLLDDTWTDAGQSEADFVDAVFSEFFDTTALKDALADRVSAPASTKEATRNTVIRRVGEGVTEYLLGQARTSAVAKAVALLVGVPEETAAALVAHAHLKQGGAGAPRLLDVLLAGPAAPAVTDDKQNAARLMVKIVAAASSYEPDDDLLAWVLDHAADFEWLEWDALPITDTHTPASYTAWERLHAFFGLVKAFPDVTGQFEDTPYSVRGFFDLVLDPAATPEEALTYAARLTGLDASICVALDTHLELSSTDLTPYHDPATLGRVIAAATMLRQLGIGLTTGVGLVQAALTPADAAALRAAAKARYADTEWLGVLGQVQDGLRERKRDALVAYLLATDPSISSTNELYDHYLIDVATGSCKDTSRIVQAHATVQLFAQRCLMGLEPSNVASVKHDDGWKQWPWMADFRMWEVNRKIFLWPENGLEPNLRDDKSEFFLTLEETLQQNPLTEVTVEDAVSAYLESLGEVAHVDVLATYYEARTRTTHVFAKTKGGDPAVYHHREFQQERYWTPWRRVPIDITGEHLLAFDRNGRLTLAWPVFTEEPDTSKEPPATPDPASLGGGQPNDKPDKRWKIQLAVSERVNGQWRPKRVSQSHLVSPFAPDLPPLQEFNFFAWGLGSQQAITCVGPHGGLGSFALTGCKGHPEAMPGGTLSAQLYPRFADTELRAGRFEEANQDAGDDLTVVQFLEVITSEILGATPGQFKITYPLQISLVDWVLLLAQLWFSARPHVAQYGRPRQTAVPLGTLMPYFYGDYDRTYVVVPGFYDRRERPSGQDGPTREEEAFPKRAAKTFSDVHELVSDVVALLTKYLKIYSADPSRPLQELVQELLEDPEFIRIRALLGIYGTLDYGVDFRNFHHPLVCAFRSALHQGGLPGLLDRDLQLKDTGFDFEAVFRPSHDVVRPCPRENVDFTPEGAYASYNWELFFHLPFGLAKSLNRDQQFEAAHQCYQYILNPVGATDTPAPQKYWNTKPFFEMTPQDYLEQRIDSVLMALAADPSGAVSSELAFAVSQWREKPFREHVVARSRPVAYQVATVLAYVQNLIDWGDHLFRQYTRESVTKATQLYVMAHKMLGDKPRSVPPAVPVPPKTFNELEPEVDLFGNALLDLEALVPDVGTLPHGGAELPPPPATLTSLYFCIPPNRKMLEIWDLVEDRLFKIRHCRTIDGVEVPQALFSPPIDPGALARAIAGGTSVSEFAAGLGAPLPHHRFTVLARKAAELTSRVGALGTELLGILERRDAEALTRMRADHEIALLAAMRDVKESTKAEAEGALRALERSRDVVAERERFYASQEFMNTGEHLASVLNSVSLTGEAAVALGYILSGGLKLVPNFMAGAAGFGGSPTVNVTMGGQTIGNGAEMAAATLSSIARAADKGASMAATQAGYHRRMEEWQFQADQARSEQRQLDAQIDNAKLHLGTLDKDLAAHDKQATAAAAERDAMHRKYTNQELYEWMAGQIAAVHHQAYQLAFDLAKKAERSYCYELACDKTFIRRTSWDSRRKGLMAHVGLEHDIVRMEASYLADDKREYELTKHISLAQLDPAALLRLRALGRTTIQVPETAFDIDHPNHYMRRIKSAAVSLVCSAGPHTTVAATLTLVGNKYRRTTAEHQGASNDKEKYAEVPGSDERFAYNVGTVASIATSTAASDSGVFELDFRDERYLPFEGAGAISTWQVELSTVLEQIDRRSITDLVLHLKYTAREGGSAFRKMSEAALIELSNEMLLGVGGNGWYVGLSLREHFPDDWWQLTSTGTTQVTIGTELLPFAVRAHTPTITAVTWVAAVQGSPVSYGLTVNSSALTLQRDAEMKRLCMAPGPVVGFDETLTLSGDPAGLEDLTMLVHYALSPNGPS